MDKLNELYGLCKASVTIIYNEHKDYYHTVESFLNDKELMRQDGSVVDSDLRQKMIETGHMYTLHAYPDTPIGFYTVYDYTFEGAVDQMLNILKNRGTKWPSDQN